MSIPHFIVHDAADTVGVIVVEGVSSGMELDGWVMENDSRVKMTAKADIPLGHKIALGQIEAGGHAHVQNVKTKKW